MKRSLKDTLGQSPEISKGANKKLPDDIEELAGKYKGMSEAELMGALLSETRKRKAEGSYDRGSVMQGVNSLLPLLNPEQREKLMGIIAKMDRQ